MAPAPREQRSSGIWGWAVHESGAVGLSAVLPSPGHVLSQLEDLSFLVQAFEVRSFTLTTALATSCGRWACFL